MCYSMFCDVKNGFSVNTRFGSSLFVSCMHNIQTLSKHLVSIPVRFVLLLFCFFFISCDILFLRSCFVYCDFLIFSPLTVVPLFSDVHYPSDILFLYLYITTFMHGLLKKRNEISTGI